MLCSTKRSHVNRPRNGRTERVRGNGGEKKGDGETREGGRRGQGVERERRGRRQTTRRYATEYHYPDNGPAISSAACINLRVKGQDARYLNK